MALPLSFIGVPLFISPFLTPIFFMFFKHMESKQKLVVPKTIKISMQFSIAIVALWIATRLFASTIPGGGPGFVVNQYGIITVIPAIGLLLVLDIIVLFKSYGKKTGKIAVVVVILAAAIRSAVPFLNDYTHESQWNEYCETAKDEFNVKGENIEKLEFYNFVANTKYLKSQDGQMRRNKKEYLGLELLNRGVIDEYEVIAKGIPKHYSSKLENNEQVKIRINETKATHRVSYETKTYFNGPDSKRWVTKQTISITNKKSGKIVAHRVQFIDHFKGDRSCSQVYNNQISAVDFIEKTIEKSSE